MRGKKQNRTAPCAAVIVATAFCLLFSAAARPVAAGGQGSGFETVTNALLVVRFEPPLREAAQRLIDLYPRVKDEVERRLGLKGRLKPVIVLLGNRRAFQDMAGNRFVVAFARPSHNLIVIDYSKIGIRPWTMESVVRHEYCHLLLHDRLNAPVPRWLDEGLCQWISEGVAEILLEERATLLNGSAVSGGLIGLTDLTSRFPGDGRRLILAYEESRSVVAYLSLRYGEEALRSIVARLQEGMTLDEALATTVSLSPKELEEGWKNSLRGPFAWFYALSIYLYEFVFFAAAVATVWGFAVVLRRRKRRRAQDSDDPQETLL